MARKRIGELLLERRAISPAQLDAALAQQRHTRQRLGGLLVAQGAISEDTLAEALAVGLGLPLVDLRALQPEWAAVHLLRASFCEQHALFPFGLEVVRGRKALLVAMSDPLDVPAVEEIEFTTGLKVEARVAPQGAVHEAILRYYHKVTPEPARAPPAHAALHSEEVDLTDTSDVLLPDDVVLGEDLGHEPAGRAGADEAQALAELIEQRARAAKARRSGARSAAAAAAGAPTALGSASQDLDYLFGGAAARPPGAVVEEDPLEQLERKFWALMRIMARKGMLTREEFLRELDDEEKP